MNSMTLEIMELKLSTNFPFFFGSGFGAVPGVEPW